MPAVKPDKTCEWDVTIVLSSVVRVPYAVVVPYSTWLVELTSVVHVTVPEVWLIELTPTAEMVGPVLPLVPLLVVSRNRYAF